MKSVHVLGKVVLRSSPLLAPLICVRVVTRGDYPQLVKDNVARNMKICLETGLENFYIGRLAKR